jgi:hypothetical protein
MLLKDCCDCFIVKKKVIKMERNEKLILVLMLIGIIGIGSVAVIQSNYDLFVDLLKSLLTPNDILLVVLVIIGILLVSLGIAVWYLWLGIDKKRKERRETNIVTKVLLRKHHCPTRITTDF